MSGFDENPFGEPMVDNPFADPAIQQVARNTNNTQRGLEDYNPFEHDNQVKPQVHQDQPAIVQPSVQSVPPYNRGGQQYQTNSNNPINPTLVTTAELQRRQEELERKAQELDRREEALRSAGPERRNNWPPLPEKCCVQPCFYQDINVDIPTEFQKVVRQLYYLWGFYALTMCVNVIGAMLLMFSDGKFAMFGLAIFYCVLFTPASFLCWYRPGYKAFRSDSSFNFMIFFFVFFFQMLVTIFQTIGLPSSGTCGFIIALQQFHGSVGQIFIGIFCLLIAISFGICAAGDVMLLTKVHSIYRSSGASFAKAQAEFTSEFVRNPHVQQAAANAATAAVNTQLNTPRY